jgi:hypothetical protein
VRRDVILSWLPGKFADSHNVYLGTVFAEVDGADIGSPVLVSPGQKATAYNADPLDFGQTYYWRIDEVNAPASPGVFKGEIWSFTVEPFAYPVVPIDTTASSSLSDVFGPTKTIDRSGLDENDLHSAISLDMWQSQIGDPAPAWIKYELDASYRLHELLIWNANQFGESSLGIGVKDMSIEASLDDVTWTSLGDFVVPQAPGLPGYAANPPIDLAGTSAKYVRLTLKSNWGEGALDQYGLSEVRLSYIPVVAREPFPASGATDVDADVILDWRAGRKAASHNVYLSTDEQAVIDGTTAVVSVTDASYSSDLDLGSTYYWRIDEVNDADTPAIWQGDVWDLTTQEFIVVEDFESYNDIDPPDPDSNRIFESWSDGFGVATNGALVGYDPPQPSYAETVTVHGGDQSMPLSYSNTGGATISESTRTFAVGQDWTGHGIQTLALYFYGTPGNTGQLYVKINGVQVNNDGDSANLGQSLWQVWPIDLTSVGTNLQSVTSLAIGVEGSGATGTC